MNVEFLKRHYSKELEKKFYGRDEFQIYCGSNAHSIAVYTDLEYVAERRLNTIKSSLQASQMHICRTVVVKLWHCNTCVRCTHHSCLLNTEAR